MQCLESGKLSKLKTKRRSKSSRSSGSSPLKREATAAILVILGIKIEVNTFKRKDSEKLKLKLFLVRLALRPKLFSSTSHFGKIDFVIHISTHKKIIFGAISAARRKEGKACSSRKQFAREINWKLVGSRVFLPVAIRSESITLNIKVKANVKFGSIVNYVLLDKGRKLFNQISFT